MNAIKMGTKVQTVDGIKGVISGYPTNSEVRLVVVGDDDRYTKVTVPLESIIVNMVPVDAIFDGTPAEMIAAANVIENKAWGTKGLPVPR